MTSNDEIMLEWFRTTRAGKLTSYKVVCTKWCLMRNMRGVLDGLVAAGYVQKLKKGFRGVPIKADTLDELWALIQARDAGICDQQGQFFRCLPTFGGDAIQAPAVMSWDADRVVVVLEDGKPALIPRAEFRGKAPFL